MSHPLFSYVLLDRKFYESLDAYRPDPKFCKIVEDVLGSDWKVVSGGFWSTCIPLGDQLNIQGWKLHISGTPDTADILLRTLTPVFSSERVAFKFCSDLYMVKLSTSKNWSRTAAGKFITVYPTDFAQFVRIADHCKDLTEGLQGPDILTDRPYKDSRVVFYRYGGHSSLFKIDEQGLKKACILSPEGNQVPDERVPFFRLPPWVDDPFTDVSGHGASSTSKKVVLKAGRYEVSHPKRFSSCGGIYQAIDRSTGDSVIIREARPLLGDGLKALEKECRILKKLGPLGVAPKFIDLFQESGHGFLVQEHVVADDLWGRTMGIFFANPQPSPHEVFDLMRELIRKIIRALDIVHEQHIVLRDFTKTNVLITPDGKVKMIDFELAYEADRDDQMVAGSTFGYASPQQLHNDRPAQSDDYYALGALIMDMLTVRASELSLNRSGALASFRQALSDIGLPQEFATVVERLIDENSESRMQPSEAMRMLDAARLPAPSLVLDPVVTSSFSGCPPREIPSPVRMNEINQVVQGIASHVLSLTDHTRDDRLWPASAEMFLSNPISIRFGAAGIAHYLWLVGRDVDERIAAWILDRANPASCPPGLYSGLAGVALVVSELGMVDDARRVLDLAWDVQRTQDVPGLYEGTAGLGLVNLHFYDKYGESEYLGRAEECAARIMSAATHSDGLVSWPSRNHVRLGLGSGPSGIALFLIYLYAANPDERLLDEARAAVDFEIKHAYWLGDRLLMHEVLTDDPKKPKSPHMKHGSGGVGTAALRLYALTGEVKYRQIAEACCFSVSSRATNKLWQDWGLAGFGELLLDAYIFLGEQNYLNTAYYIAEGILPHQISVDDGIAFPGQDLVRMSCDFGLGSAGIGSFLYRLLNPTVPRFMLLDHILMSRLPVTSQGGHTAAVPLL